MRIVLFASPGIIGPYVFMALLQKKMDVVLLVTPPNHPYGAPADLQIIARQQKIHLISPSDLNDSGFYQVMHETKPDIIFVATFDKLIPKKICDCAKLGAVNIHPSLLPKYRGACPEFWAIKKGEKETGVSIHYLSDEFDTGRVIAQKKVMIGEKDTVGVLSYTLAQTAAALASEVIDGFAADGDLKGIEQNDINASKAPLVTADDLKINWEDTRENIYNLVRAANPVSAAWTMFRGFHMKVWHVEKLVGTQESDFNHEICGSAGGMLLLPGSQSVLARCSDGFLILKVVQPALYYIMDAWNFAKMTSVKNGEVLG